MLIRQSQHASFDLNFVMTMQGARPQCRIANASDRVSSARKMRLISPPPSSRSKRYPSPRSADDATASLFCSAASR